MRTRLQDIIVSFRTGELDTLLLLALRWLILLGVILHYSVGSIHYEQNINKAWLLSIFVFTIYTIWGTIRTLIQVKPLNSVIWYDFLILVDTLFFSSFYMLTIWPDSDLYLFYILPLLTSASIFDRSKILRIFAFVSLMFILTSGTLTLLVYRETDIIEMLLRNTAMRWLFLFLLVFFVLVRWKWYREQAQTSRQLVTAGRLMNQDLTRQSTLDETSRQAWELARILHVSNPGFAAVLVPDEHEHCLTFASAYPLEELSRLHSTVPQIKLADKRNGIVGQSFIHNASILVHYPLQDKTYKDYYIDYSPNTSSILAVPIIYNNSKRQGVIVIEHFRPGLLSSRLQQSVQLLAEYAASSLINSDYLEESRRQNVTLSLVEAKYRRLAENEKLDELLLSIISGAQEIFEADQIAIYLINRQVRTNEEKNSDTYTCIKKYLYPDITNFPEPRLELENTLTRNIIRDGNGIYIADLENNEIANEALFRLGFTSMIGQPIPLKGIEDNFAVLFLFSRESRKLSSQHNSYSLQMFCNLAGEIIAKVVSHQRLTLDHQRLTDEIETVNKINQLAIGEGFHEAANLLVKAIVESFSYHYAVMSFVDKEAQIIVSSSRYKQPNSEMSLDWVPESKYSLETKDILTSVVHDGEIVILHGWDDRLNKEIYEKYDHKRLARAYIPLGSPEIWGVLETGYVKDQMLKPDLTIDDLYPLLSFINHAAVPVEKAHLRKEIDTMQISYENKIWDFIEILEHNHVEQVRDFVNKHLGNVIVTVYQRNHDTDKMIRIKFDDNDAEKVYFKDAIKRDESPLLVDNNDAARKFTARSKEGREEGLVFFIILAKTYDEQRFRFVASLVTAVVAECFYRRREP